MTVDNAIGMAKSKLKCIELRTSSSCQCDDCDNCSLNYEQGNMGEQKEWLAMSIKALEQTRWIPADESPKTSGRYLVITGGTNFIDIDHYTTEEDAKETYDEWYEAFTGWNSQNVIKWMQLPESEPYKAESEDAK